MSTLQAQLQAAIDELQRAVEDEGALLRPSTIVEKIEDVAVPILEHVRDEVIKLQEELEQERDDIAFLLSIFGKTDRYEPGTLERVEAILDRLEAIEEKSLDLLKETL